MTGKALQHILNYSYLAISKNVEGISHDESLQRPDPGGNCLNWTLGHLLVSRNKMLLLMGADAVWDTKREGPYHRGSGAISAEEAEDLYVLLEVLDRSQKRLLATLEELAAEQLAQVQDDGETLALLLAGLGFHESYHAGQIGLLRRLLGYPGAIR